MFGDDIRTGEIVTAGTELVFGLEQIAFRLRRVRGVTDVAFPFGHRRMDLPLLESLLLFLVTRVAQFCAGLCQQLLIGRDMRVMASSAFPIGHGCVNGGLVEFLLLVHMAAITHIFLVPNQEFLGVAGMREMAT